MPLWRGIRSSAFENTLENEELDSGCKYLPKTASTIYQFRFSRSRHGMAIERMFPSVREATKLLGRASSRPPYDTLCLELVDRIYCWRNVYASSHSTQHPLLAYHKWYQMLSALQGQCMWVYFCRWERRLPLPPFNYLWNRRSPSGEMKR